MFEWRKKYCSSVVLYKTQWRQQLSAAKSVSQLNLVLNLKVNAHSEAIQTNSLLHFYYNMLGDQQYTNK